MWGWCEKEGKLPQNHFVRHYAHHANYIYAHYSNIYFNSWIKIAIFFWRKSACLRRVKPQPATPHHTSVFCRFVNKRPGSEFVECSTVKHSYVPLKDRWTDSFFPYALPCAVLHVTRKKWCSRILMFVYFTLVMGWSGLRLLCYGWWSNSLIRFFICSAPPLVKRRVVF